MTEATKTAIERTAKLRKRHKLKLNSYEILEYFLMLLTSKIRLFSALSPFGLAYFAATFPMHDLSLGAVFAFLGIILSVYSIKSLKYIGALSLYLIFMLVYNKDITDKKWISGTAASLSLFAVGTIFIFLDGFLMYDMMLLSLECIISFVSFFIFNKASITLRTIKSRKVFEQTDVLSIVFLFSVFLLCVLSIPGCEPLAHTLAVFSILLIAYTSGFELSVSAGLLLGIVMSINSPLPAQVICTYAVSSLCAGILQAKGKLGICLGFLCSNALMMIYMNGSSVKIIDVVSILVGTTFLLILPKSFISAAGEFINTPIFETTEKKNYVTQMVAERLNSTSMALCELSDIFKDITHQNTKAGDLAPAAVFDSTIEQVCRKCNLSTFCWHKNCEQSANAASEIFTQMTKRGFASEFDVPSDFRASCIHFDDFLESLNKNYELQKISKSWAAKVYESRMLVAEQFKDIAYVFKDIENSILSGATIDPASEQKIKAELDKKTISVNHIRVTFSDCCRVQIVLPYAQEKRFLINLTSTVIGGVMGYPFYLTDYKETESEYIFNFCEKANFSIDTGFAKTSDKVSGTSGDSHLFSPISNGKYVLCLSDGMGRGIDAAKQSKTTVDLIGKLLNLGFSKEIALKIINTFLLFKSQKEVFATADICIINLHSGALEFIKSGAVSSYIKSGTDITKIKCSSLPAGAVATLDSDCELKYAKDGDFIIMVTDGITDVLETGEENILKRIIEGYSGNSPQELSDIILQTAMQKRVEPFFDDMTVLVSKITEEL